MSIKYRPANFEVMLDDGNEAVSDDGDVYLDADGVLGLTPESLDLEMLLDPLEQLHLPPIFIKVSVSPLPTSFMPPSRVCTALLTSASTRMRSGSLSLIRLSSVASLFPLLGSTVTSSTERSTSWLGAPVRPARASVRGRVAMCVSMPFGS